MKKKLKFLFVLTLVVFSLVTICFAKEIITIPTFNVEVNGYRVDSSYRQYPLIVYNGITYFPMTYTDARFLGIETEWDSTTSTLEIGKTGTGGEYDKLNSNYKNPSYDYAERCNYNILVNGKRIYNSREEYPLLTYRNVTYFPLTWRFAVDEFGWNYSFDNKFGLRIRNDGKSLDTPSVSDEILRPVYGVGNCKDITKPTTVMVIFVDDKESKWTKSEADAFFDSLFRAEAFLDENFARYGKSFDAAYAYMGSDACSAVFPGKTKNCINGEIDSNIGEIMAKSMGYASMKAMDDYLKQYWGRDQVAYIFAVNKIGRSYSINDSIKNGVDDGIDTYECNVIFNISWEDKVTRIIPATIAHEMLHMFGAEDFYGNAGSFRKEYFENNHPNEIMRTVYNDISYNTLSDITAFNVGVTDTVPDVVLNPEWWS